MFDNASNDVVKAVKDFKSSYPDSLVWGFSMYVGYNVLMQAIKKGIDEFDCLLLVVPPVQNEEKFNALLLERGYNYSKVIVITAEGDEAVPLELQGHGGGFTLIRGLKE